MAAFLLANAGWLVVLGLFNLRHPSDWALGDWLINYTGGFVRRGFIGEVALLLHGIGIPPIWAVLLLQWSLYAIMLLAVWRLIRDLQWSWWTAAFLVSPATLAFDLLDPPFAYRKEILFFALMASIVAHFARRSTDCGQKRNRDRYLAVGLSFGCACCVLAHEGLLMYFPYLFGLVVLGLRDGTRALRLLVLPASVSIALFVVVSRFPGDAHVAQTVCQSIGGQLTEPPTGICGGAIAYLSHNAAYAHAEVRRSLLHGAWRLIPSLFVLPFVPLVLGLTTLRREQPFAFRVVLLCALVAGVLSTSLFYYGTDWTRWVYIHALSLMLLTLFAEAQRQNEFRRLVTYPAATDFRFTRARLSLLLLYMFGWELTVYGQRPLYASFFRFVSHHVLTGKQ